MLEVADECTALVAVSSDPGAGTAFHKFSGRIWAFRKRNATLRNANIHYHNTNKKKNNWNSQCNNIATLRVKVTGNRDEIMSQH